MNLIYKNSITICLQNNYLSSILKITIVALMFPILHMVIIFIIILLNYKLVIIPLTYTLCVFLEEYFHSRVFIILYPNSNVFFYKEYFSIYKYPLFTIAFGIQSLIHISSLNQIYISFFGPINALCFNLLISPLFLLIDTQSFYTFLLVGTFIPLLSLFPKKFPIISDGYRILKLSKGEGIKFGKKFWSDFILLEKRMFQDIIWK